VCTIALGVPGSVGAAIFLGIMIIFGIVPGPLAFTDNALTVYSLFAALAITSFLLFLIGAIFARHFAMVTLLPNQVIVPLILVVSLLGSFTVRNLMSDVFISLVFGILGYVMLRAGYTPVPLLLGMVLGDMVASNYHRALLISGGAYSIFYASVIAKFLIFFTLVSLFYPCIAPAWNRIRGVGKKQGTFEKQGP